MAKEITSDALAGVKDRGSLFALLQDKLDWPLDPEDTFTYPGMELSGDKVGRADCQWRWLPHRSHRRCALSQR